MTRFRTYETIHHIYDEDGNLTVWEGDAPSPGGGTTRCVWHTSTHVYVYRGEQCMLQFAHSDPGKAARSLANLIFNTNKEYAS